MTDDEFTSPEERTEEIRINLVVGGSQLDVELDLDSLAEDLDGITEQREKQPGLLFRFAEDEPPVTIHTSGKYFICAGSKTELDKVNQDLIDLLNDMGVIDATVEEVGFEDYNYVGEGSLGRLPDLDFVAIGLGLKNVYYEPEDFSAIIYENEDLPCETTLIYGSGKVILPGGKSAEDCVETYNGLVKELEELFPSSVTAPKHVVLETDAE